MHASLNSKLYTVAALREIATRMGLTAPSKAVKADIVALITDAIETAHAEALEINASFDVTTEKLLKLAIKPSARKSYTQRTLSVEDRMRNRVQNYMESNGTDKLTKAQLRRIRKKSNRTGVNPWALCYDYRTVFTS